MKKTLIIALFVMMTKLYTFAQSGIWTQIADCPTAPRYEANAFSIGN